MFYEKDEKDVQAVQKAAPVSQIVTPVVSNSSKPSFQDFLRGQASAGNWTAESRDTLLAFIDGDQDDPAVKSELAKFTLSADADTVVYLTLLAIYILEEAFADREDEWQLIVTKAKKFLERAGVQKPANVVKKFTLTVQD